jgi:glycine dehydrogenase
VAHECIIDIRPSRASGITVDDIAKRLMDFGFHAPTMSFPVAGTLMIEPTESESLEELDRFCDAHDRDPRRDPRVERGEWPRRQPAGQRAAHAARSRCRSLEHIPTAASGGLPGCRRCEDKYWPPVARVDNVYGDRHL